MRLLDNRTPGRVIDALRDALRSGARASLLTHELSLFALDALRPDLERLAAARLLLAPSPTGPPPGTSPPTAVAALSRPGTPGPRRPAARAR